MFSLKKLSLILKISFFTVIWHIAHWLLVPLLILSLSLNSLNKFKIKLLLKVKSGSMYNDVVLV